MTTMANPDELARALKVALDRLATTRATLDDARRHRDKAIVAALDAGASSRVVADAAGMSAPGVLKLYRRTKGGQPVTPPTIDAIVDDAWAQLHDHYQRQGGHPGGALGWHAHPDLVRRLAKHEVIGAGIVDVAEITLFGYPVMPSTDTAPDELKLITN